MAKITIGEFTIEGTVEEIQALGFIAENKGEKVYRKVTDREPRVGDFVKYSEEINDVTPNKYYEIIEIDFAGDPQIIDDEGDEYDTAGDDYEVYELVTKLETEQEPEQALQVGDYAKVIHSNTCKDYIGKIVEIAGTLEERGFDFEVVPVVDGLHEFYPVTKYGSNRHQLVKATDEEVAQAKAELAKQLKDELERLMNERDNIEKAIRETEARLNA